ncbi:MAG: ABC transporter permease [Anaerotignum sp.]|uniref:ABC transporter permease n=1 Tax=Anaerotignum sp. TaxID=2039241 RepID=UPI0039912EEC
MLEQIFSMIFTTSFGYSIIRITSPILFAALAAVVAEKAGVTNIGLEGIMMISALFGVLFAYWTSYWWVGVIGAVVVGIILALIIGVFALKLKTDIILAGIAINLVGSGGTIFLLYLFTGLKGNTASLTTPGMLTPKIDIPILESIPILGPIFSGHSVLTYVAFILVLLVWILLYKTAIGLQIRAVGENSHAADSVGISVLKIQYIALGFRCSVWSGRCLHVHVLLSELEYRYRCWSWLHCFGCTGDGSGGTSGNHVRIPVLWFCQCPWQ